MPKHDLDLAQLEALAAVPGALKVITSEVQPDLRRKADDPRSPAKESADPYDPATFVQHDVTRIEPHPARDGVYVAWTDEGDFTMGRPAALLARLQQWRTEAR